MRYCGVRNTEVWQISLEWCGISLHLHYVPETITDLCEESSVMTWPKLFQYACLVAGVGD